MVQRTFFYFRIKYAIKNKNRLIGVKLRKVLLWLSPKTFLEMRRRDAQTCNFSIFCKKKKKTNSKASCDDFVFGLVFSKNTTATLRFLKSIERESTFAAEVFNLYSDAVVSDDSQFMTWPHSTLIYRFLCCMYFVCAFYRSLSNNGT